MATPLAGAREKTEVTPKKNVSPQPEEERRESKRVAKRQQKAEGKLPTARGGSEALRRQHKVRVTSSITAVTVQLGIWGTL